MALGAILAVGAATLAGAAWLLRGSNQARSSIIPQIKAALRALPPDRRAAPAGGRADALGGIHNADGSGVMLFADEDGDTLNLYAVARFTSAHVKLELKSEPGERTKLSRHRDDPPDYVRYEQAPPKWLGALHGHAWSIMASPFDLLNVLDVRDLSVFELAGASWAKGDPALSLYTTPEGLSCNVRVDVGELEPGWIERALLPWLERLAVVGAAAQAILAGDEIEVLARHICHEHTTLELAAQAIERLSALNQPLLLTLKLWLSERAPLPLFVLAVDRGLLDDDDLSMVTDQARLIAALEASVKDANTRSREALVRASVLLDLETPQDLITSLLTSEATMGERLVCAFSFNDPRFEAICQEGALRHPWSQDHLAGLWDALSRAPQLELVHVLAPLGDTVSIESAACALSALVLMRARLDQLEDPWREPWLTLSAQALVHSYDKARSQWSDIIEQEAPPAAIPLLVAALKATDSELDRLMLERLINQLNQRHAPPQLEQPQGLLTLVEGADAPQGRLSLAALSEDEGALSLIEAPNVEEE